MLGVQARGLLPDPEEFRRRCREINVQTLRRAKPSPHAQEIWRKTKREIEKGIIQHVRPIQEVDLNDILLVESPGVGQQSPTGHHHRGHPQIETQPAECGRRR